MYLQSAMGSSGLGSHHCPSETIRLVRTGRTIGTNAIAGTGKMQNATDRVALASRCCLQAHATAASQMAYSRSASPEATAQLPSHTSFLLIGETSTVQAISQVRLAELPALCHRFSICQYPKWGYFQQALRILRGIFNSL
jgi:hypothetical protein